MPAEPREKSSASPAAATPASAPPTPDKPRTASAEHRKSSKPIMEKRRRARINESLGQLKTLILDALKKDSSRHSKLEKADILEMTVKHLRSLQRAHLAAALQAEPSALGKYRAGFGECLSEVSRFLATCDGVSAELRGRLLAHLAACMSHLGGALDYAGGPPQPPAPAACKPAVEGAKLYGGFRLVPASDGQLALLVPDAAFAPHGGALLPLYAAGGGPGSCGLPPPALSPAAPAPSLPADSLWRPW